jgi:benzoate-CoA ligase
VDGYELELRDEHDRVIEEVGTPGFLHVKGASLATGYWSRVAESQSAFRGEWLRTGDVYQRVEHGGWAFLGRNNDMIKAGGIWVSPAEVEAVLIEHPDVLEAAVVGARDDRGLELVVAFVVPRTGRAIDDAAIEAHCRERMASFKRPRRVLVIDQMPKTATGKIRRFALRDALAAGSG